MEIGIAYDAFTGSFSKHLGKIKVLNPEKRETNRLDLLIFSGGEDIDPKLYGSKINGAYGINDKRDTVECQIWENYINGVYGRPKVLGVCRGIQFVAAMRGFKLIQDLDMVEMSHNYIHKIKWEVETPLSFLPSVNSMHHQAVHFGSFMEASRLAIEPTTEIAEAILFRNNELGVQFHPEFMGMEYGSKFFNIIKDWVTNEKYQIAKIKNRDDVFREQVRRAREVLNANPIYSTTTTNSFTIPHNEETSQPVNPEGINWLYEEPNPDQELDEESPI